MTYEHDVISYVFSNLVSFFIFLNASQKKPSKVRNVISKPRCLQDIVVRDTTCFEHLLGPTRSSFSIYMLLYQKLGENGTVLQNDTKRYISEKNFVGLDSIFNGLQATTNQ